MLGGRKGVIPDTFSSVGHGCSAKNDRLRRVSRGFGAFRQHAPGPAGPSGTCDDTRVTTIDWPELREAAREAATHAYVPYSRLRVGAAGVTATGLVVIGCNVENASYGLTLCAECALVSALHTQSPAKDPAKDNNPTLVAVAVVAGDGAPLLPCGRCRQLLLEAGGPALLVDTESGPVELDVLLPAAFSGTDLAARREPAL
jgi:cytidine deaminase